MDPFYQIELFENELAQFTGSPYAVATDCCTHAIELALRYDRVDYARFSAYTYLSVPMTFHKLKIQYELIDDQWIKNYNFVGTRIIDSARYIGQDMYRPGSIMCLSFGRGKPLDLHRGGALLLDDVKAYEKIKKWRYDGRDLSISPWAKQRRFPVSFHYKMTPDEASLGREKLQQRNFNLDQLTWKDYPDCRQIEIYDDHADD